MKLSVQDCSPFDPPPTADEVTWLQRLASKAQPQAHVMPLGGARDEDEPIVYCERDGTWWAGRYVGELLFEGHSLTILPRFGMETLRTWLAHVFNLVLVETPGQVQADASFIVQLLAALWVRGFVDASRHGLPALRTERASVGLVVRGRLDVAGTVRLRAANSPQVASLRRERSLDNATARAIVSAYAALRRWMAPVPESFWLPSRAAELLPHLIAVTGSNPQVPSSAELARVRYTPLTAAFKPVAELSRRIALRRGLSSSSADGTCQGVLLDVAELWELYVLAALRRAAESFEVRHGTLDFSAWDALLRSELTAEPLGMLKPDALVLKKASVLGILDAKYKRLHPSQASRRGPQREDLYQMAAYLSRYGQPGSLSWGALAYPYNPDEPGTPPAESGNPWALDGARKVYFLSLPHTLEQAASKLRRVLLQAPEPMPLLP
ncbi:5-methylcytosine restriction system specificity protein McrC [Hyalangium minutum]|uniref:McrBC 5-methylcytosine restriction system component n=1 Tax=Hyalangium minutum TaxID=394096 RepID=A0A085W7T1_9BACT|nr:hypothetical protein [Hyalangium minutum]KFE63744.1 hypothetical protein DB31_2512 [Hyalangium minutum]